MTKRDGALIRIFNFIDEGCIKMIKIVVDTKGADKGADELVSGVALALEKFQRGCILERN